MHPSDVGPNWDPREDDADARRDPLYKKLVAALRHFQPGADEVLSLFYVLHGARGELLIEYAIASDIGTETSAARIKACRALEKSAALMCRRLDYFHQLLPLDRSLFEAFKLAKQADKGYLRPFARHARDEWDAFRDRLHSDMTLLREIADRTGLALKTQRSKGGRPRKAERDRRFTGLLEHVSKVDHPSEAERIELAWTAWITCFGDMKTIGTDAGQAVAGVAAAKPILSVGEAMHIEDLESAQKIVQKRNRRGRQGEKA